MCKNGSILGAAGGALSGKVEKVVRGNNLKNMDFLNKSPKMLRNEARSYYNDYIKETHVNRNDIGQISFSNVGIDEVVSKGLHNVNILPNLKNQIKNGTLQKSGLDYSRKDISNFDTIGNQLNNKNYEYQIAKDKANGNKFYFVKDVTNKQSLPPTDWNQHPGSKISSTSIIPNNQPNLNPWADWLEDLRRQRGHK